MCKVFHFYLICALKNENSNKKYDTLFESPNMIDIFAMKKHVNEQKWKGKRRTLPFFQDNICFKKEGPKNLVLRPLHTQKHNYTPVY